MVQTQVWSLCTHGSLSYIHGLFLPGFPWPIILDFADSGDPLVGIFQDPFMYAAS